MTTAVPAALLRDALTDEEIVSRIVAGDPALFEILMRRHNQRIYRAVRAVLRSSEDAEDVMQQAYLSAYQHLRQFAGASRFSTWLTRIAVNEAIRRRKRGLLAAGGEDEVTLHLIESSAPVGSAVEFASGLLLVYAAPLFEEECDAGGGTLALTYSEILPDECASSAMAFLSNAVAWFASHSVQVERVMTDNGSAYVSYGIFASRSTSATSVSVLTSRRRTGKSSGSSRPCFASGLPLRVRVV